MRSEAEKKKLLSSMKVYGVLGQQSDAWEEKSIEILKVSK